MMQIAVFKVDSISEETGKEDSGNSTKNIV